MIASKDYVNKRSMCTSNHNWHRKYRMFSIITNDTVEKQFENRLIQLRYLGMKKQFVFMTHRIDGKHIT